MMRVYLAAQFARMPELGGYAVELEIAGIAATSRWLLGGHEWVGTSDDDIPVDRLARFAQDDLADIEAADIIVCFTESPGSGPARGGRHFEAGYAYAAGKPIVVVGGIENIFYALPGVRHFADWEHALQVLINARHTGGTCDLASERAS